jgi:hypothetical protein
LSGGRVAIAEVTPRLRARLAGALYLVSVASGLFAEMFVRAKLVVYSDPAATADNILASQELFRMGFFADVTAMMTGVFSAVLTYLLLKPVGPTLALAAFACDVISNTVSIGASILLFAPLVILPGGHGMSVFTPDQLQALALLSIRLYELAYSVNLAVFSCSCLLTGYLIFRSTFLPRILGVLLAIAGICYLTNSVVNFMPPAFGQFLFPWILLPCLLAEGVLALWLCIAGVDSAAWESVAGARRLA